MFLGPLYRLEREMGEKTRELLALIEQANWLLSKAEQEREKKQAESSEKGEENEIL